jgi:hypothetical protein
MYILGWLVLSYYLDLCEELWSLDFLRYHCWDNFWNVSFAHWIEMNYH